ncbi:hypothetical protein BK125_02770 [Paenibacillus odorifer]|uniref:hypothetical protein n=1 Tax=Paenibacillus odorifer TaxID=189426 RepID=UPI00096C0A98|nr:hypothetical protein [Paenibacillus odorifer]OMC80742.1 hypothetical protein BK125_02770 [Paenibacillus odorifer]
MVQQIDIAEYESAAPRLDCEDDDALLNSSPSKLTLINWDNEEAIGCDLNTGVCSRVEEEQKENED